MKVKGDPRGIEPRKVRRHDNEGAMGLRHILQAFEFDQPGNVVSRSCPQHPVIQGRPRQMHVGRLRNPPALRFRFLRKTEREIRHRHVAALGDSPPQKRRQPLCHPAPHGKRHVHKGLHHSDPKLRQKRIESFHAAASAGFFTPLGHL